MKIHASSCLFRRRPSSRTLLSLAIASAMPLAAVACSAPEEAPAGAAQSGIVDCPPEPASPCAAKACGADCTPEGSDEPFNCNAAGACVAVGAPLGCTQ